MGNQARIARSVMRIVWSETAIANLIEIKEFIEQDTPGAARRVATRILSSAEQLTKYLHLGHPGREPDTRELVVAGTPYILPYRVVHGKIFILAVLHARETGKRIERCGFEFGGEKQYTL